MSSPALEAYQDTAPGIEEIASGRQEIAPHLGDAVASEVAPEDVRHAKDISPSILNENSNRMIFNSGTFRAVMQLISMGNVKGLRIMLGEKPLSNHQHAQLKDPISLVSPLHYACQMGHVLIAQYIVETLGANVNDVDISGCTPLHFACLGGHVLVVRYLVNFCGADLTVRDNQGRLAIESTNQPDNISEKENITRIISKGFRKSVQKRTKVFMPQIEYNSNV